MKIDPAFCNHTNIGRTAKVETISVPELQIEQLVLRVRVFCKDCKEAFVPKTMNEGFSTGEIGVVGEDVIIPLEYPQDDRESVPDEVLQAQDHDGNEERPPPKDHLH